MVKNRFFKNTLGYFAELIIASKLDDSDGAATTPVPATVSIPVTIAADPTPGDTITITIDGTPYVHAVPGGDETTQAAHDAIAALLEANAQGFVLTSHTGTTSSVFNLAWAGAVNNAKAVTLAETGATFTVAGPYAFAGGVDGDAVAADTHDAFVANADPGAIWAYWEDINAAGQHTALFAGDTANPANANRKFFYAWKDANGEAKASTAIPVRGLKYDSLPYSAGQVQISDVNYGGTITAGQILHLRITDTTSTQIPYPTYHYDVPFATDIATTVTALAAKVNAETEDPIATASAAGAELTVTGLYKNRTFSLQAFIEVTPQQPTDASIITFPGTGTQKAVAPVGDIASIRELEKYYLIYGGALNYPQDGTNLDEWQDPTGSNIGAIAQWGILLVKSSKVEKGAVYDHTAKAYVVIAVPTGSQTALAAL